MDNAINNSDIPEVSEHPIEEPSRFQELIANIPWGKIILGVFILFLLIWALIFLFSGNKTNTLPTNPASSPVTNTVDQGNATSAADLAMAKLGGTNYNQILQPYFSLENPNQFSANDTRVALLQALNTLESTVDFDLLAHLATQNNREQALNLYEQKLRTTIDQIKQLETTLQMQSDQMTVTLRSSDQQVLDVLSQLNSVLQNGALEGPVTDAYHAYMKALRDRGVMQLEQSTLHELLRQVTPLLSQAEKRLANITQNRQALIQNIQIIDANDPGLSLIKKP